MPPRQQNIPPQIHRVLMRQKTFWIEQPPSGDWGHIHIMIEGKADFDWRVGHDEMLGENFDTLHTYERNIYLVNSRLHSQLWRREALAAEL